MIVAFVNQKGGCGKSTTAVHFAYWLHQQGKRVVVVDADAQQSASRWLSALSVQIPCQVIQDPDQVMDKLPSLDSQHDFVVVDGAGGISELTRCILLRCHLAVLPVQPTGLDLDSSSAALKIVAQAQSVRAGLPKACVLISRADAKTVLFREARDLFQGEEFKSVADYQLLNTHISQRQVIADCFVQDSVIWQMKRANAAAAEFNSLCEEILSC